MRCLNVLPLIAVLASAPAFAQEGGYAPPSSGMARHALPGNPPGDWNREAPASPEAGTYEAIDSQGGGAIPSLPLDVETQGDARFINGGVGDEELAQLKATGGEYNLHLLFSSPHGDYISGVTLHVKDAKGQDVLTVDDAGPYVYAHLPPGKYTLEATSGEGAARTVHVSVPAKGNAREHFVFKAED